MHVKLLNATLEVVRLGSSSFRTLRAAFRDFQCCKLLASHKATMTQLKIIYFRFYITVISTTRLGTDPCTYFVYSFITAI